METTSNLKFPFILSSQAQKHVTHNEALNTLDALVQLSVINRTLTSPPLNSADGDRYIITTPASDEWSGKENQVAAWQDGTWFFYAPRTGWQAWIEEENAVCAWNGSQWLTQNSGTASVNPTPMVGVNSVADQTNKLSVSSEASLFNHEGSDHRLKINKQSATDTASVLFQNNFSGYAEFGLTGDNNFHMKVSPDGSTFHEGIVIDKDTGHTQCSRLISGIITIADDSIGEIPTPYGGGFVFIMINDSTWPQANHSAILAYDTGNSLNLSTHSINSAASNLGTTTLTGTTGTDGRTSIAVKSGALVIENRWGATQKYSYTFIG